MIIKEIKPTLEVSMDEVKTFKSFYEIFNKPIFEHYGSYEIVQILEDIVERKENFYVNIVYKED